MVEENVDRHESYGLLSFSRCQGSEQPLFGSSINHTNFITLEIKEGEQVRNLHTEWVHDRRTLLRAMMSSSQFADAITTLNSGVGVPITLEYVHGDEKPYRERPPEVHTRAKFEAEIGETVSELVRRLNKLEDNLTRKRDKEEVKVIKQHLRSNLPFLEKQFARQMDKTVTEAKAEVEAFITARELNAGVVQLQGGVEAVVRPQLSEGL